MTNVGTIALDIDGTITDRNHCIPPQVITFFLELTKLGWQFVFLTGRPFSFALQALDALPFPYLLALQNGADLLSMPERRRVGGAYLPLSVVQELDLLYKESGERGDFLVYAGFERGDLCYFRPQSFDHKILTYLKKLERTSSAPLVPVTAFGSEEQQSFPLIKCFGEREKMERLQKKLGKVAGIKVTLIQDPISEERHLLLITHLDADKGVALKSFTSHFDLKAPFIVGGNDNNDLSLLKAGDTRIAMVDAPEELRALAHIIAPPSTQLGIIEAIKEAISAP